MTKKLMKSACFTDIHFGRKNNSVTHNEDCLNYIRWFCDNVKKDSTIDHIIFLGDWHEHRSAINGLTLDYSNRGAKMLNELGLPVYIIVGNHDLYYKTSRNVYTTNVFESLGNITVVDKPLVCKNIGKNGTLICPFLFHNEYSELVKYFDIPIWFGHFEFKGFVLTGETYKLDHGPDPRDYKNIKRIFCGHFHKRQQEKNIIYIGNAFPADYNDANDFERGMMIYDHSADNVKFIDWKNCPKYVKTNLTTMLDEHEDILFMDSHVWCLIDKKITFNESNDIRKLFLDKYDLRELRFEESAELLSHTVEEVDGVDLSDIEMKSANEVVPELIDKIESKKIDNERLKALYREL